MKKFILGIVLFALVSACKKKCELPTEDVNSGIIVPGTHVKETSPTGGDRVIREGDFYVSYNKGYTYEKIDWDEYCIVSFPMNITCNAQLERNVEVNYSLHLVTYTITTNTCSDCTDKYTVANMVLVPVFPENFKVRYKRIDNEVD